ncbi:enoyl-CoA hydratase/isomerase family protein [Tsukamurella sp. NPDC003166]|uniref:enoyl-CoA hydratase/isomerase family protein n=1 Tax=Tsukamurella sp. NPDC003166 TaxID=3154444 RepID=UPI0033BA59C4
MAEEPGAPVTSGIEGALGVIELNRPAKNNAFTRAAWEALSRAITEFEEPGAGVRVVLVRARGENFCTGGDLIEAKQMMSDRARLDDFLRLVNDTIRQLERSRFPVVAACRGLALAGGLELLLGCDVVFASRTARFGDQHVQYGLVPAWGASQRLPRAVGMSRALDLMYSGRWISAETAHAWGLVGYLVEDEELESEALKYCMRLTARSAPGLAAMKELGRASAALSLDEGLERERRAVLDVMAGPDPAEGIAAFEARRTPVFRG